MQRLTRLWFAFSDLFAWTLVAFSLAGVIVFPLVGPLHARMSEQPITTLDVIGTCALWLVVAAGAYVITRRKAWGLLAVMLPAVVSAISGRMELAVACAVVPLLLFATPFLLVLLQTRTGPTT